MSVSRKNNEFRFKLHVKQGLSRIDTNQNETAPTIFGVDHHSTQNLIEIRHVAFGILHANTMSQFVPWPKCLLTTTTIDTWFAAVTVSAVYQQVRLSLCLTPPIFDLGGQWSSSRPGRFTYRERSPAPTRWCREKYPAPSGNRTLVPLHGSSLCFWHNSKGLYMFNGKDKVVPVLPLTEHHAIKAYWESGGTALPIPWPRH
jgi:hypothetical protein